MSCLIIAEIGTSHRGDLNRASDLICQAAESGADFAKFQIVLAGEIIHPLTGTVPLPGGEIPLFECFKQLEQKEEFYRKLKEICADKGIGFMATPFGRTSAGWLKKLSPSFIKIASPELNHLPLLEQLASFGIPLILSAGVSKLKDIETAVEVCSDVALTLMHCITAYPAPEEEYNLSLLPLYGKLFGCSTGVSDHSRDPLAVPLTALWQGAGMIEKHICLKRSNNGLDDPFALEPRELKEMVSALRELETLSPRDQEKELISRLGSDRLQAILGSGKKELAPSEKDNYGRTNRSVHALSELKTGTTLTEENTALLRTEKVLRPGLPPRFYRQILGKKLSTTVPSGEGIRWEDLLD